MKRFIFIIYGLFLLLLVARPLKVEADQPESGSTADLVAHESEFDDRIDRLKGFLTAYNSPLASAAEHFVSEADRLGLDWRLVAAIAGVESTFGKHIPTGSFNAWGWGVFTGTQDGVHFRDWEDGISQVLEGLRNRYIDRGAVTVEQIGRIYAASPAWPWKVRFFLQAIEEFAPNQPRLLDITI